VPGRSAEQLSRSPGDYRDHKQEERRRILAALLAELERARHQGAPWYRWIEWRSRGEHRHELMDEHGRAIACPVAGCDAVRGAANPHPALGGRTERRRSST
jgi:hypothetical protein